MLPGLFLFSILGKEASVTSMTELEERLSEINRRKIAEEIFRRGCLWCRTVIRRTENYPAQMKIRFESAEYLLKQCAEGQETSK